MKKLALLASTFLLLATNLLASQALTYPTGPVIAFDADRNNQITAASVKSGEDAFLVREVTSSDVTPKNSFIAHGKTYVPVQLQELKNLDANKDGIITLAELNKAKTPILSAHFQDEHIIVERPLVQNIQAIQLPITSAPNRLALIVTDNNVIRAQLIELQ
jgi:hypothetical protein